ncbi:CD3324 family protein [Spirochaeta dissipatitropha]
MSYKNASSILPEQLVEEIQQYIQGEQLYIPRKSGEKLGWGSKNGTRDSIARRNREIRKKRRQGTAVSDLADMYNLSDDSIRKIIYCRKEHE